MESRDEGGSRERGKEGIKIRYIMDMYLFLLMNIVIVYCKNALIKILKMKVTITIIKSRYTEMCKKEKCFRVNRYYTFEC